ncbi:hypothetical protein PFLUV_G00140590 [Perca fluviatilis]|uniref:DUF6729 domain-containing protein n=1 Tax=Perca fluviatilis TaxID=8168 RepID=A0A6A5F5F6_PERFL|nr:hypothetical protein PFLUV_G00140590 [Perca fluviatilis]
MTSDSTLRLRFKAQTLREFWFGVEREYPLSGQRAVFILLPFATSYLCEMGFSAVASLKTNSRVSDSFSFSTCPQSSSSVCHCVHSEGLLPEDHKWILKTVMKVGPKGKLHLQDHLKLWFFPPQPSPIYHPAPAPDRFFAHPLLVWMPYKLWKVKVVCPNPVCGQHQLTGGGLHKRA